MTATPRTAIVERDLHADGCQKISQVTLDLQSTVYEFNYHYGGEWHLKARRFNGAGWTDVVFGPTEFTLYNAPHALNALGVAVVKFTAVTPREEFQADLADLLARAGQIKKGVRS